MSERERRLKKLAELRQQELDDRLVELAKAVTAQQQAKAGVEQAVRDVASGVEQRRAKVLAGTNPSEWAGVEAWLATLRIRETIARGELAQAEQAVIVARERMLEARSHLQRIESLLERVRLAERRAREREERKVEDETGARVARTLADKR